MFKVLKVLGLYSALVEAMAEILSVAAESTSLAPDTNPAKFPRGKPTKHSKDLKLSCGQERQYIHKYA